MPLAPSLRVRRVLAGAFLGAAFCAVAVPPSTSAAQPSPPLRDAADISGTTVGVGVDGELLTEPVYESLVGYEFSGVAPGEEAAWDVVQSRQGDYDWTRPDRVAQFAARHDQRVVGFPLVWDEHLPDWVAGLGGDQLRAATQDHLVSALSRYAEAVDRWDVVVNPLDEDGSLRDTTHLRLLGEGYIADAFRTADAASPGAALYLTDVRIGDGGPKGEAMYELVSSLLEQGVPIDGVGFQGHFELGEVPGALPAVFQRYADLGLDVAITDLHVAVELPANAPPTDPALAQQARDYAEVVTACVTAPTCGELTVGAVTDDPDAWGPIEGPYPSYYLWDLDYLPKSAYIATLDAFIQAP